MLPLSQASDRLPLRGSWQSQQALTERVVLLLDIQFGRHVDLVRDVLAVLFALTHTLGEQILDLPVHRAEVILSPCGKGIVELRIQAQGDLLFRLCHQYRLQRQQASAIIDARKMIVDGAVGMVEMALDRLSENKVVELDDERKAAMVSNLLVVLCGNRDAQPIVNSGSLY